MDARTHLLRMRSPRHEDHPVRTRPFSRARRETTGDDAEHSGGELLPASIGVRSRLFRSTSVRGHADIGSYLVRADGKGGIEQQDTMFRPFCEIPTIDR